MKPAAKGILIGCAAVVVIGVAVIGGLFWVVRSNKDSWIAKGKAAQSGGVEYGKTVTEPRCVDEAMSRYRSQGGIMGGIQTTLWLDGCLGSSAFDAGFCEGVPHEDEFTRTVSWRVEQCKSRNFGGDSTCPNLFAAVQKYCYGPVRAKKAH